METQTGDAGLTRRPTLASSWDAANGALTQSLLLTQTGPGVQNFEWEELLAPPAPGQDLVSLKSSPSPQGGSPCFLYLRCDPKGEEEIDSDGLLSPARNMEVYVGEEYCGTSRGSSICTILDGSCCPVVKSSVCYQQSRGTCETNSSLDLSQKAEKRCETNSSPSFPALGSKLDLDKIQTVMEGMDQSYQLELSN